MTETNISTSQPRKDKQVWQQQKLESCEEAGDTGKMWKNILGWLNWTSTGSPTKLNSNGSVETSPSRMAELQNKYYIEKVRSIRRNLPGQGNDPLKVLKGVLEGNQTSFSTHAVSPEQVDKIIKDLNNSKASGVDNLDTYILKLTRK